MILMKFGRGFLSAVLVAFFTLSAGCSFAPVEFYQLQRDTQTMNTAIEGPAVLIGPVKLADYLQREHILQRQPDGRLLYSREGRWAGDLQEEIGLLLLRHIAQQTGNSHIALYPDRVGVEQQAQIVLNISRLDSGPQQPVVLEAQWRLLDAQGLTRDSNVVRFEEPHDGDLAAQIKVQSELLQRLADQLAVKVKAFLQPKKAATSAARNKAKQAEDKTVNSPASITDVVAEPEVYRF